MDLLGIVGTTVGDALQTGAGTLLGTRLSDEMLAVRARMAGRLPLPENHDLVRGIRAAHLAAVRRVADAYGRVLKDRPEGEKAADHGAFHASLIAWLDERQQVLRKSALDHEQVSAEDVRHVLDEMVHPSAVEGFAAAAENRRAQAEDRALAEIAAACGAAPPEAFTVLFRGAGRAGWYDDFALFVNEELKVNVRFRAIFLAAELVDIKRLTAACDGKIAALETIGATRLGAIEHLLGAVQQDTSAIRAGVERLTAQLDLTQREKETLALALAEAQARFASTQSTVLGFLQTIVGRDVAPDQMVATLFEIARRWDDLGRRIVELEGGSRNLSPDIAPLRAQAAEAHAAGDVATAEHLLAEIDEKEAATLARLLAHHQEVAAEIALRRAEQAKTKRARADAAFTRLDWQETARLLVEAVDLVQEEPQARFAAILKAQDDYYERGRDAGINAALEVAILLAREAHARARDQDQRGGALNTLGIALRTLGERESGTAHLEEAVRAYEAALEECTRARVPLDWAMTQNNLGNALQSLGEREGGTEHLEEAVRAYQAALEERTRARVPLDWAMTQNNLGTALQALGARESATARLEEAVRAYEAALEELTRARGPLQWALIQNNLGNALRILGERESATARLKQAVQAYQFALEERSRSRVPLQWAMTQNNLGTALQTLGRRESGTARLEEAVRAYEAALEEYTRARVPRQWAAAQNNLGNALRALGERESGTARLEAAVCAYESALEERTRAGMPLQWAMTQNNLGNALRTFGQRESGTARLEAAVHAYEAALEVFTPEASPHYWQMAESNLADARALIAARTGGAGP
jgi:tetratricopeptide (TPR) repeat protein